jgi:hypothetical protein
VAPGDEARWFGEELGSIPLRGKRVPKGLEVVHPDAAGIDLGERKHDAGCGYAGLGTK